MKIFFIDQKRKKEKRKRGCIGVPIYWDKDFVIDDDDDNENGDEIQPIKY